MCHWNVGCSRSPGMTEFDVAGIGVACMRGNYTRTNHGEKQCPANSEFINELGEIGAACFEECQNGKEHETLPTCFGSCPAGTTLCGEEGIGTLCLDDNVQTCEEYMMDIAAYVANWAVAISTANALHIISIIAGDHPEVAYPMCEEWNDESDA